ncbi:hypothetical protein RvY_04371 [Ramazzottius varieornatus]|uniref:CUB domain-containing protein n=1 Tax=Ramazzottius varieornatus TaxID=947166 RepID=A0A1D1UUT1_RAMVA|nr:hypothetical protein RvY_04371 [Ramazzottius varieornatus]
MDNALLLPAIFAWLRLFSASSDAQTVPVTCGGTIHLPADGRPVEITTPNFPDKYPSNVFCKWTIHAPERKVVQVDALYFGLSSAKTSFLLLADKGVTSPSPQAISSAPGPLGWRSKTSTAEIGFASQAQSDGRGFWLSLRMAIANTDCVEKVAPKYNVSLDVEPRLRWRHVVADYPYLNITTYGMLNVFNFFADGSFYPFNGNFSPDRKRIVEDYLNRLPLDLRQELEGIAEFSNVSKEFITMANIVYEIVTFCTSIVASDINGKPIHGRNLDFRGTPLLRDETIHVDFVRKINGVQQIVYSAVTVAGSISLMTAQKPGVFTYSLNRRITKTGHGMEDATLNFDVFRNTSSTVLLSMVRQALETATTYEGAVEQFSRAWLPSPCYLIIGGTRENEGVILTRDRDRPVDVHPIDVRQGRWYVAQTNTDRWLPFDNKTDPFSAQNRLEIAERALNRTTRRNINFKTMFDVIGTNAVYNHATVFSTVMSASNPSAMETRIRCPLPAATPGTPGIKNPQASGPSGRPLTAGANRSVTSTLMSIFTMMSAVLLT